jgi:hypothetical protein
LIHKSVLNSINNVSNYSGISYKEITEVRSKNNNPAYSDSREPAFSSPSFIKIYKNISFSGINDSKECFKIEQGELTKEEEEIVNKLIKDPSQGELLGSGDKGSVYKVSTPTRQFVVKIATTIKADDENDLKREIAALQKIPESVTNSGGQDFIASGRTSNGNMVIISSLVDGEIPSVTANPTKKIPDIQKNPLTIQQISSLMDSILEHDKAGLWHNDLNPKNILTTKEGKAQIIDYGCAWEFSPLTSTESRYPSNVAPSSLISFENKALMPYFMDIYEKDNNNAEKIKAFFTEYLKLRANFHGKRAEFMKDQVTKLDGQEKENAQKRIEYEELLSEVLKNPSKDIIDLEAAKFQITSTREQAFVDNWYGLRDQATSEFNEMYKYVNDYSAKIDEKIEELSPDKKTLKKYLNYEKDFAQTYSNLYENGEDYGIKDRNVNPNNIKPIINFTKIISTPIQC